MKRISIQWGCAVVAMVVCAGVAKGQPVVAGGTLPPADQNQTNLYSQTLTATDNGSACTTCTWAVVGSSPPGLTLSPDGTLSGSPSTIGLNSITVTASATDGTSAPATFNINVNFQLLITTSGTLTGGTQGVVYSTQLLATGGNTSTYSWSLISVNPSAPWLGVSTSGVLSGTPTTPNTYTVTVQLSDGITTVTSTALTLVIAPPAPPPLSITLPQSLPGGEATAPYQSTTFTASGGTQPYTWSITTNNLPAGMTFQGGTLGGKPSAPFSGNLTFQVMDANNTTATTTLGLTIIAAPTVASASLPNGDPNVAYPTQTLTASGGTPNSPGVYTWSLLSGAPPGIAINPSTGQISGTPTTSGTFTFSAQATDSVGGVGTQPFSITINPAISITTPPTLPQGEAGAQYSTTLIASGGSNKGFTWSLATGSSLPPGLSPNISSGVISGTPTASGPFNFTVQVTDSLGGSTTLAFSLNIIAGPTISTGPTLPSGTVNAPYTGVTLLASGGTPGTSPAPPYTWSVTVNAPPAGIGLDPNTGTISGTPTATGTFNFTVQVIDAKGVTSNPKQFSITIAAGLTIVTAPILPNGTIGQPYTFTLIAAGGTGPNFLWQVISGALPAGLTLNATTGALTGSPTSNGTFTFTVKVTDSASVTATEQFTLVVATSLNITTPSPLVSGVAGGSYSQVLSASGGTAPYSWLITSAPVPGLTLNAASGLLSGTPTTGGTYSFTVTVTDSTSLSASKSFSLSIAALLAITTQPALPSGGVGAAYSEALTAVGGSGSYTWSVSAGSLPGGLSLSPTSGTISGSPTTVGNFSFTVQVRDNDLNTTTQAFTLSIVSALTITTQPSLPGGAVNVGYSQSIVVVGGSAPYTWSITSGSLPAGLTLAPASGAISGTPTTAGNFTFTVQVTDSASVKVNKAFSIAVVAGLAITTAPVLPSDSIGVSYTVTLEAAGGSSPYTWAVATGGLPGGLTLDAKSGSIFGTPTASGTFAFTVKVTDNASNTTTKQFSIAVAAGLTITTAPALPNGAIGATYSQPLGAAGGAAPYSWSITQGALPGGLTLDPFSGAIAGTPAVSGFFSFTVHVTDSASATAIKLFTLNISASLSITTPPALPNGSLGVPYSINFTLTGGAGPYQWAISTGSLPGGVTLDPSSGALSGTPATAGAFSFTVTVTDSAAHKASQQFSLTIVSGLVISTAAQLPTGFAGSPYSQTLSAAGGIPQYHWAVTGGTLPAGLGLSPAGVLSGTPSASGAFKFTVQVTDSTSATASLQFSLSIGAGLTITSPSTLPSGTPGQPYTALQLAAAGGSQCCTWAITNGAIAPGLALSAGGIISGTPTAAGAFTFTVQATDSSGAKASQAFTISILPPALPQVNISGVPETATSAQQINFSVALASGYPLDITGTVTLTFAPDAVAPADDPAILLSTGSRTATFKIAANTKNAVFSVPQIALQTGTVSGAITLTFTLETGGAELPSSGLTQTITIARTAPTISAVKIVTSSNSFQVQVTGFSPPRELTEADLTFTPASGSTLQTTKAIIDLTAVGKQWFASATSAQFGSQFILVMPFTATQGSISAVASVSVVLKDATGASSAASASF